MPHRRLPTSSLHLRAPTVFLAVALSIGLSACSHAPPAERFRSGDITVTDVLMQEPMAPGGEGAAGSTLYCTVRNAGGSDDSLVAVRSERVGAAMLHGVDAAGRMAMVSAVPVPAGGAARLRPGGYHVMLVELVGAPAAGDTIPFELVFRRAGALRVRAPVVALRRMQEALDRAAHH